MKETIKDKIEKLLNLSMSDNEHEAKLALERALKLMNEHNITKDEVYRQQMTSIVTEFDYIRIPEWVTTISSNMTYISGCHFTWGSGFSYSKSIKIKAQGRITGRERDVQNATYLIAFVTREIEKASEEYRKRVYGHMKGAVIARAMKSFKVGMANKIALRIHNQRNQFFSEQTQGTGLVCIDLEARLKDAMDFLKQELKGGFKEVNSKTKHDMNAIRAGEQKADEIEINQAVHGQKEVMQIGG